MTFIGIVAEVLLILFLFLDLKDLCHIDAKSLTSFWPLLLPENDVLQPRYLKDLF